MKIRHYQTVDAPNVSKLDIQVNDLISDGWQPFGNPYQIGPSVVCQAMVLDAAAMNRMKEETDRILRSEFLQQGAG